MANVSNVTTWVVAAAALAATAFTASASTRPPRNEDMARQVASLAASVERLQQRPSERVVEYHTTREVTPGAATAEGAPAGSDANVDPAPERADGFDQNDVREYTSGRGPHPVERLFEREPTARGRDNEARQRVLDHALARAAAGVDANIHSAECRASTCRVEATFGSIAESNRLIGGLLTPPADGSDPVEHGGMYAPVQESVGDRHHTVFYLIKKRPEG
jgi:hypothetical protein